MQNILYYSSLIKLLSKFDFSFVQPYFHILINTHSPYFLRAIEVYSQKYEIASCVKYYLSYNEEDISKMKDVTLDISKIYKVLSKPLQRIEDEAYND